MKNIAVVMGGYSAEKLVSMKSGSVVIANIDSLKYKTFKIVIDQNGWFMIEGQKKYIVNKKNFSVKYKGQTLLFDGVFMAIHGIPGENGELQEYFDKLNIPYNTSGKKAAELSFDKYKCNNFLKDKGIFCANSISLNKSESFDIPEIIKKVGIPCFVKPNSNGSSFGISKVNKKDELVNAIEKAFHFDDKIIIESFLNGVEVTCGIHNFHKDLTTLPITEIVSENDFFDYEAKYEGKSKEITPARLNSQTTEKVYLLTKKIYRLLNLNGIARIDFIIVNGEPYIIEANTVPGLSEESIIPQQAKAAGINLKSLFYQSIDHIFDLS